MLGLAHNRPSGTFRVRNLATGEVVHRQGVSWHPQAEQQLKTAVEGSGDGGGEKTDGENGTGAVDVCSISVQHLQQEEPLEEPQQEQQQEQPQPANRAMHQLSDYITGEQPALMEGRTRSGATRGSGNIAGAALCSILRSEGVKPAAAMEESSRVDDHMAMQAALTMPEGLASFLPPEPNTVRQAMASPERDYWKGAMDVEMEGLINNNVWEQVPRPEGTLVVGTKMIFKRKVGPNGEVEKYKCRLVARGFQQVQGLHYEEKISPTPTAASIRMVLATVAVEGSSSKRR